MLRVQRLSPHRRRASNLTQAQVVSFASFSFRLTFALSLLRFLNRVHDEKDSWHADHA